MNAYSVGFILNSMAFWGVLTSLLVFTESYLCSWSQDLLYWTIQIMDWLAKCKYKGWELKFSGCVEKEKRMETLKEIRLREIIKF